MRERLVAAILLLIPVVWLINNNRPTDAAYQQTENKHFWIEKTHDPARYNFLVCGDSRIYRGISSKAIEKQMSDDYQVFNYGYSSGSYSNFMLDKIEAKIDTSENEPILLLGITPYSLTPRAAEDGHIKEELARKKEEIFEYRYLIPLKLFFEPITIQQLMASQQNADSGSQESPVYFQEFYPDEGWVASWKVPSDSTKALEEYVRDFTGNTVDSMLVKSLIKRISGWVKKGIKVYAFRPPTTKAMVALENRMSGFDESSFEKSLEEVGGQWISIPVAGFVSYDGSHLEKESALKLSTDLGKIVNRESN